MKDLLTHDLTNLPLFSVVDMALLHDTTEEEVRRVATSLSRPPDGPFETDDFYRINRILMPLPEPKDIGGT